MYCSIYMLPLQYQCHWWESVDYFIIQLSERKPEVRSPRLDLCELSANRLQDLPRLWHSHLPRSLVHHHFVLQGWVERERERVNFMLVRQSSYITTNWEYKSVLRIHHLTTTVVCVNTETAKFCGLHEPQKLLNHEDFLIYSISYLTA